MSLRENDRKEMLHHISSSISPLNSIVDLWVSSILGQCHIILDLSGWYPRFWWLKLKTLIETLIIYIYTKQTKSNCSTFLSPTVFEFSCPSSLTPGHLPISGVARRRAQFRGAPMGMRSEKTRKAWVKNLGYLEDCPKFMVKRTCENIYIYITKYSVFRMYSVY